MKTSYQIHKDSLNSRKNQTDTNEKLAWWWAIPLAACVGLVMGLTFIAFYKLPDPINDTNDTENFIASRARQDLEEFVAIGPKVVGSAANEQTTVHYLQQKLNQIERESIGLYDFEVDLQEVSGGFMRDGYADLYEGIQNVVVKITPKDSNYTTSLLVNSHFDTVPDSPGASDDGCMVVVMLGVLSTLTKSKTTVRHPVVFLFNGAEENGLQGSHAFITKHKWRHNIGAFVNLDSTGTGGKEILFQTGPNSPWLVNHYAKAAVHPYATVIGEEIFEREVIPSDTDFRIFRDYGHIPGLDMAYAYNDYVYHTRYDDIDAIEDGTYQHTGDNVLQIIRSLANADELEKNPEMRDDGKAVFFDVFGIFMLNYSETTGIIVNVILCVVAILTMALSMWLMTRSAATTNCDMLGQFAITLGVQLLSLLVGVGLVIFLAFFYDAINYSMSWYSQPWMIFGLYFIPFIYVTAMVPALFLGWKRFNNLPLRFRITLFLHAHCLILIILVIVLTALSFRTAFFVVQCVLFYTVAILINSATKWYLRDHIWIVPILVSQAIPISFVSYIMEITYSLFIPITGRMGAANNPEMLISLMAIAFALLIFGFISPIFSIFQRAKTMLTCLPMAFVIFFILMFTEVCFPYTEKTMPQRQALLHTKRIMYNFDGSVRNNDAGYYAVTWDRLSAGTIEDVLEKLKLPSRDADMDCATELYCGLPIYHPMMLTVLTTGFWIDSEMPNIERMPSIEIISKVKTIGDHYRYTFELRGTKQNEILIKAAPGSQLVGWSFMTSFDKPDFDKEEHFVHLRFGVSLLPYRFSLDLKVPDTLAHAVTVGLVGHIMQGDVTSTNNFLKLMSEFPKWTHVQGVEATYQSWDF